MRRHAALVMITISVTAGTLTAQTIRIGAVAATSATDADVLVLHEYDKTTGQRYGTMPLRYVTEARRQLGHVLDIALLGAAHDVVYATRDAAIAAAAGDREVSRPAALNSGQASFNALGVLHLQPALGRDFTDADARARRRVAILTAGAWQRLYQGRSDVIGASVWELGANPLSFEIVGVLPAGAMSANPEIDPEQGVILLDPTLLDLSAPFARCFAPIVRLKPGVTLAAAQRAVDELVTAAQRALGDRTGEMSAILDTLRRPAGR